MQVVIDEWHSKGSAERVAKMCNSSVDGIIHQVARAVAQVLKVGMESADHAAMHAVEEGAPRQSQLSRCKSQLVGLLFVETLRCKFGSVY